MRARFDQLAKAILSALIEPIAPTETAREIPGEVQVIDVWVESDLGANIVGPDADNAAKRERLGVLGRMLERGPCLIEPFSEPPGIMDVRSCMTKQYNLGMYRHREARRCKQPEPVWPGLWIISSGWPQTVIGTMKLDEMPGWPAGFRQRLEFDAFYLVDVHALPRTLETLVLRLLGRKRTFDDAVVELLSQPEDAWPRSVLQPVLVAFGREIPHDLLKEEEMKALRELRDAYAEMERRIRSEGREEGERLGLEKGERLGLVEGIEMLCAALEIELNESRRAQLATSDIERLKATLAAIGTMRRWPEADRDA
jgi:hypothetical protein